MFWLSTTTSSILFDVLYIRVHNVPYAFDALALMCLTMNVTAPNGHPAVELLVNTQKKLSFHSFFVEIATPPAIADHMKDQRQNKRYLGLL
jgi:hypothetical protein